MQSSRENDGEICVRNTVSYIHCLCISLIVSLLASSRRISFNISPLTSSKTPLSALQSLASSRVSNSKYLPKNRWKHRFRANVSRIYAKLSRSGTRVSNHLVTWTHSRPLSRYSFSLDAEAYLGRCLDYRRTRTPRVHGLRPDKINRRRCTSETSGDAKTGGRCRRDRPGGRSCFSCWWRPRSLSAIISVIARGLTYASSSLTAIK